MRDYYRYHFKVGNYIVHGGITNNLDRRENEHKISGKRSPGNNGERLMWSNGHIKQVGHAVTKETAKAREEHGFGLDQH